MKPILDDRARQDAGYLKLVFSRTDKNRHVSRAQWIRMIAVELFFGEELIEQLTNTASYNNPENPKVGEWLHLSDFVPYGFFTNLARRQLLSVLYYKYYVQYFFLLPESKPDINQQCVDTRRTRFGVSHDSLHRLVSFRRVYVVSALVLNLLVSLLVFFASNFGLEEALLASLLMEGVRRLARF